MRTETKWASIAAFALLLLLILMKLTGLHSAEKYGTGVLVGSIAAVILFIIVYYRTCKEKRDNEYNGVMSWQEGFWACARMTLIYIPLSCLVVYLYMRGINPEFEDVFIGAMKADGMYIGKDATNDQLFGQVASAFVFGTLFSLIFPIFTKRAVQAA